MKALFFLFLFSFGVQSLFAEVNPSDSYLDFGTIEVGDSEFLEVELTNEYDKPVVIERIDLDADFGAFDLNENCLGLLREGDSCFIEVVFSPYEWDEFDGEVDIETSTGDWFSIELFGEGIQVLLKSEKITPLENIAINYRKNEVSLRY